MKYGKLTLGQIEAHINKLGGEKVLRQHLMGEVHISVKENYLSPCATSHVATTKFNPRKFLEEDEFRFIRSEEFERYIGVKLSTRKVRVRGFAVPTFHVKREATDLEILSQLPKGSIFRANAFCSFLRAYFDPEGELNEDPFESIGNNIFYVHGLMGEIYVVYLTWKWLYTLNAYPISTVEKHRPYTRVFIPK